MSSDPYELSRELEARASEAERRGEVGTALELWREYAELKGKKGSYFLASYGRYRESRLLEGEGRLEEAARGYEEAAELAARGGGDLGLFHFLMLESARCWSLSGRPQEEGRAYELLAGRAEGAGEFFRAAEAWERAAEAGTVGYERAGRAWLRCAEAHRERGDLGDALWGLRRARRCFERAGRRDLLEEVEERERRWSR
ncbi:MAG: hypothetical protein DSO04_00980 [Hadesarchaea archaeon]|nr:MAG: hypothetical protein DSO04_00980 [Hadesarchaea archaeon]